MCAFRWPLLLIVSALSASHAFAAEGEIEIGCSLKEINKTAPDVIRGGVDIGHIHVVHGADRDIFAERQKERIWHYVENGSNVAVSVDWRDPDSKAHILFVPFYKGIPKGTIACVWHESEMGAFGSKRKSFFKLNDGPDDLRSILFYRLVNQDQVETKPQFLTVLQRAYQSASGGLSSLFGSVQITPLTDSTVEVSFLHSPAEASLLVASASIPEGLEQLQTRAANFDSMTVESGPLASLTELPDAPEFAALAEETFVRLSGFGDNYFVKDIPIGDYSKPMFVVAPDQVIAIGASVIPPAGADEDR